MAHEIEWSGPRTCVAAARGSRRRAGRDAIELLDDVCFR